MGWVHGMVKGDTICNGEGKEVLLWNWNWECWYELIFFFFFKESTSASERAQKQWHLNNKKHNHTQFLVCKQDSPLKLPGERAASRTGASSL